MQEFEALDPKMKYLVLFFFAEISDSEVLFLLPGGLESPTFRLTVERSNRLRHKRSIKVSFMKKYIFERLKLINHS